MVAKTTGTGRRGRVLPSQKAVLGSDCGWHQRQETPDGTQGPPQRTAARGEPEKGRWVAVRQDDESVVTDPGSYVRGQRTGVQEETSDLSTDW